jgi:long-chain acyl-CoA synthetase
VAGIASDCSARALLFAARKSNAAVEVGLDCRSLEIFLVAGDVAEGPERPGWIDLGRAYRSGDPSRPPRNCIDRDLACLIYTSGSTGRPKGVMSGHHNVVFAARSITSYLQNTADDVVISALPLSFDYGLYQWLMVCLFGGMLVLERSFAYPAEFLQRLAAERATGLPGVPTMFAMLLDLELRAFDLRSLRYLTSTGAALPVRHIERLRQAVPQARVFPMYGLTETKRALYLPPEDLDRKSGSVGVAIPGTEVWLEDPQGNRLGADQVGLLGRSRSHREAFPARAAARRDRVPQRRSVPARRRRLPLVRGAHGRRAEVARREGGTGRDRTGDQRTRRRARGARHR